MTSALASVDPAERHRRIAAGFTEHVGAVSNWAGLTPVADWTVRDIVDHLIDWSTDFLSAGGVALPPEAPDRSDPAASWLVHCANIQALLAESDPDAMFVHPMIDAHPLRDAVDRFYTADVFMHTWDLATACGRASGLEPSFAAGLVDGMAAMDDVLRSSGQFGPAVPTAADANPVVRMAGFIGRDPHWRP